MGDRLGWIPLLQGCLGSASHGNISVTVEDTIDPLKKNLVLKFTDPLPKNCWNPFQRLVHAHAVANDCAIPNIKKRSEGVYVAEVLLKRRSGPTMANDPFELERKRSDHWKEEFYKKLRHKPRVTL